jgi:HJR/Mrr/RecB family endonuclease
MVDAAQARALARSLQERDFDVWLEQWHATPEEDLSQQVLHAIQSRDSFVVLLSPESVKSAFVQEELATALDRRDVDVVPVLLETVRLPTSLTGRHPVDLRETASIDRLVDRLLRGSSVDLSDLSAPRFEALVAELLERYGFTITEVAGPSDRGFDLVATYTDPLGLLDPVEFLVNIKLYRQARVSVLEIRRFVDVILSRPGATGLLVTNAQLTSPARETLSDLTPRGNRVRAIDGPRLRQMLLEHPDIARQFGQANGTDSTP